ncbi:MAG: response regulator [Thermodesulfobacteriota bacterium]
MRLVSIKDRFVMVLMITSLTSLVIAGLSFSFYELHQYKKKKELELMGLVELIGPQSLNSLMAGDKEEAVNELRILEQRGEIRSAALYNAQGNFFAGYQRDGEIPSLPSTIHDLPEVSFIDNICTAIQKLEHGGKIEGFFLLAEDLTDAKSDFVSILIILFFVTIVSGAVSYALAFLLHDQFKKPIVSLVETARFICDQKGFKARARKYSSDEMGLLSDTINSMLDEITGREEEMTRLNEELESRVETRTAALQEINARLLAEKKRADRAATVKSDFLANMSHEIRTPMNGIVAACDLAMDEELAPKVSNYLKIIQSSSHDLLIIVNDILDFSRLEAGTLVLDHNPFSLPDLFTELNNFFSVKAHDENIDLIIDIAPDVPSLLIGDRGRFRQILYNLVDNGLKFTHEGIVSLYVSCLDMDEKKASLEITVRDTGVGLSTEGMERIFSSFHQEDSSSTRQFGGAGLGLAISRQLARMMDGTIDVESELGKGATFVVTVRLGWRETEGESIASTKLLPKKNIDISGMHVLIVEDNETNLGVAEAMLTGMGMTVDSAANGEEAVGKTCNDIYDVIFMDMQMPVMDGYEAMKIIRKKSTCKNIPIIAMTAHALAEDKDKCLKAGADGYVSKPVHKKRLLRELETVLEQKALTQVAYNGAKDTEPLAPETFLHPEGCVVDVERAVRQLGVKEDVYHRVLKTFCNDYVNFNADYEQFSTANDIAKIQKMVHSLKGSSATIGAEILSHFATEADKVCKKGEMPPLKLAAKLLSCLKEVLSFARQIEDNDGEVNNDGDDLLVKDSEKLLKQLQDLADSLDQSMYDNINICLEGLEGNISGKRIVSLSKMIRMYSYEDALTLVHEIAKELELPLKWQDR